jgi:hypothetical protein
MASARMTKRNNESFDLIGPRMAVIVVFSVGRAMGMSGVTSCLKNYEMALLRQTVADQRRR